MLVPVCSPLLLERLRDTPLNDAPLIHLMGAGEDWQSWADACGEGEIKSRKGIRVDTAEMAIHAAVEGLGIAIGRRPFVDPELAAGALVHFRDKEVPAEAGMWLVAPPDTFRRGDVQAFRNWLFDELRAFRKLDDPASGGPKSAT